MTIIAAILLHISMENNKCQINRPTNAIEDFKNGLKYNNLKKEGY